MVSHFSSRFPSFSLLSSCHMEFHQDSQAEFEVASIIPITPTAGREWLSAQLPFTFQFHNAPMRLFNPKQQQQQKACLLQLRLRSKCAEWTWLTELKLISLVWKYSYTTCTLFPFGKRKPSKIYNYYNFPALIIVSPSVVKIVFSKKHQS